VCLVGFNIEIILRCTAIVKSKNEVFIPIANLTSVQKGITCSGITIHNSLPSNILNFKVTGNTLKMSYTGIV